MGNLKFVIALALLGGALVLGYGLWPTTLRQQATPAQARVDQTRNPATGSEQAQNSARQTTLRTMPPQPTAEASAPSPDPISEVSLTSTARSPSREPEATTSAAPEPPADGYAQVAQIAPDLPAGIDTNRATDLFVDQIAALQAHGPQTNDIGPSVRALRRRFADENSDPWWSAQATTAVHDAITAWYAELPEEVRYHLALIAVECRASLCEILAAADDPDSSGDRINAGQDWQVVADTWPQTEWWHDLGFVDITKQTSTRDGYLLYMIYLVRHPR
ncbi:MAG: hypothetical protein ABI451_02235 [Dokdonella sp.]